MTIVAHPATIAAGHRSSSGVPRAGAMSCAEAGEAKTTLPAANAIEIPTHRDVARTVNPQHSRSTPVGLTPIDLRETGRTIHASPQSDLEDQQHRSRTCRWRDGA